MDQTNKTFFQIVVFIVLSISVGIAAQWVLPNGISIKTQVTEITTSDGVVSIPSAAISREDSSGTLPISLEKSKAYYDANNAIFFDARTHEDYLAGHIQNAINLPIEAFMDSLDFLDTLPPDTLIITYCDGADCNASIDLAAELDLMGFSSVYFFFGGWAEWQAAGYPISGISLDD